MGIIVFAVRGMAAAEALRNQHLDRTADEFVARVTEQFFGARVRVPNYPAAVGDKDCIRGKLEETLDRRPRKTSLNALFFCRRVHFRGI